MHITPVEQIDKVKTLHDNKHKTPHPVNPADLQQSQLIRRRKAH